MFLPGFERVLVREAMGGGGRGGGVAALSGSSWCWERELEWSMSWYFPVTTDPRERERGKNKINYRRINLS